MKDVRILIVYSFLALFVGGTMFVGIAIPYWGRLPTRTHVATYFVLAGIFMSFLGICGFGRIATQTRTAFWTSEALQAFKNLQGRFPGGDQAAIIQAALKTYECCIICLDKGATSVMARWPNGYEWPVFGGETPVKENGQSAMA
jgi:hypothetical protein